MIDGRLLLHEELLLLGLHERSGELLERMTRYAMAAGLLAEMQLAERVELTGSKPVVRVLSREPLADPLTDLFFERVAKNRGEESARDWIDWFAREENLIQWTAEELCEHGILAQRRVRARLFFTERRFPQRDPEPELEARERIEAAVLDNAPEVDERTAALVALAFHADLLRIIFPPSMLRAKRHRIDAMCDGTLVAGPARRVIRAVKRSATLSAVAAMGVAGSAAR